MEPPGFKLDYLVIGCKNEERIKQLQEAISITISITRTPDSLSALPTNSTDNDNVYDHSLDESHSKTPHPPFSKHVVAFAESHNQDDESQKTQTEFALGSLSGVLFKVNHVPLQFFQNVLSHSLSDSVNANESDSDMTRKLNELRAECKVVSTSPFAQGYVSSETEIYIIIAEDFEKDRDSPAALKESGKYTTSSQFTSDNTDKSTQANVHILSPYGSKDIMVDISGTDRSVSDQVLYISMELAIKLGVMNESWVKVKLDGSVESKKRIMSVIILNSPKDAQMSCLAWLNLGGFESEIFFPSKSITIERYIPRPNSASSQVSPSSASVNNLSVELSTAKKIAVARVNVSDPVSFNLRVDKALKEYLQEERYHFVGDYFVLHVRPYSTNALKPVLMKVVNINELTETDKCYLVDQSTATFEDAPVRSFIPSGITNNRVDVGRSLEPSRKILTDLLKPFIKLPWSSKPLPFVILSAPEGSGKTLLATQIAKIFQCNFVEVNCINIMADGITTTETNIKSMLMRAKELSPAVLLLKNIDLLTREDVLKGHLQRLSHCLSVHMEEITSKSEYPVIILGTANKLKDVSEDIREIALYELEIKAPDASERQNILEDLTAFLPKHTDVDLEYLAEHTAGLFYGDLQALVTHAERNAMRRAHAISIKQLGCVNQEAINRAKILVSSQDFDEGLDTIQGVQSLDLGTPKIPNVKWKDIGGLADVKKDILDTIQLPLRHPELFMSTMRRSGVLLYGPPGTGKTLLAKAVATECALNFFSVKGPELINMYVGQSEENIRQVFQKARSASPCVIFFDELDSLAPNRGKSGDSGGVMDRVVSQLLAELDGLVKSCDVFVIGATNRPDLLDSALLRPGRFDKLVYVGISSTSKEQLTILKAITRKFELDPDCELEKVANTLPSNLTGADLYSLCSEATTNCIKRMIDLVDLGTSMEDCKLKVNLDDFMKAAESITPSLSANEIKKYEQLRYQFSLNAKNKDSEKVVEEKSMEIDNIEELLQVVGKGVNNSIPPAGDGSGEEVTGSSTDM